MKGFQHSGEEAKGRHIKEGRENETKKLIPHSLI